MSILCDSVWLSACEHTDCHSIPCGLSIVSCQSYYVDHVIVSFFWWTDTGLWMGDRHLLGFQVRSDVVYQIFTLLYSVHYSLLTDTVLRYQDRQFNFISQSTFPVVRSVLETWCPTSVTRWLRCTLSIVPIRCTLSIKTCYRSVFGLTGAGSRPWSGSPVLI